MSVRSLTRCLAGAGALCAVAVVAAAQPEPATPTAGAPATAIEAPAAVLPDFSGTWYLDRRASDDPERVFGLVDGADGQDIRGDSGGGRGAAPRRTLDRPSMDPDRGRETGPGFVGSGRAGRQQAEAMAQEAVRESGSLEIFHSGDEFDLTNGAQVSRMLRIGGEPTEVLTPRGSFRSAAAWDGRILTVTDSDPQGQVRRTRQFSLSVDRSVLTVRDIRHRSGKEGDLIMTMIYRHDAPASDQEQPERRR